MARSRAEAVNRRLAERPQPRDPWARWLLDTIERTARTFAQGVVAVYGLDAFSEGFDPSNTEKLGLAAFMGGLAVVFSIAGKPFGAPDSASFLPENTDPPQGV